MNKRAIRLAAVLLLLMIGVNLLSACGGNSDSTPTKSGPASSKPQITADPVPSVEPPVLNRTDGTPNPQVTITMENGKQIVLVLYPDKAPNTVNNFLSLVQSGYYDGLTFHRVKKGFMIQGGDPQGTGSGGPGYNIVGEFASNGFTDNDISHLPGVISMARQGGTASQPELGYDTAGSQFFICAGSAPSLDGDYAAFGMVASGLEEVYEIAKFNTSANGGPPSTPQTIKAVTADTFGVEYPKPEIIK